MIESLDRAKSSPLHRWLFALGIPDVGESAARELARLHNSIDEVAVSPILAILRDLSKGKRKEDVPDLAPYHIASEVGPVAAASTLDFFSSDAGRKSLARLHDLGINPASENFAPKPDETAQDSESPPFAQTTWVITGTLSQPRDHFKAIILDHGGKVAGSVSKNTSYLLAGENAGSKRTKAEALGTRILDEAAFLEMLGQ